MKVVNHNRMSVQIEDVKPGEVFVRYGYSDPLIKVAGDDPFGYRCRNIDGVDNTNDVDKEYNKKEYNEYERIIYYGVSLLDGQSIGIVKGTKVLPYEAEVHIKG